MTEAMQQEIETKLGELDFRDLTALHGRIGELVEQRRSEVIARLEKEAELIGATIHDGGGVKHKRGRRKQHHEA